MPKFLTETPEQIPPTKDKHIYTVSQITQDIKLILEENFGGVWVEGEISNLRTSPSGHYYFSLKDGQAILQGVIFIRAAKDVKFKLEDGLKVICFGNIEVYPPHGKYQLIIEKIEPKGIGSLQLALEQLKKKLEKEGLFSPAHKKALPHLPSRIGVVTSVHGAAIKDILKVLERRFKDVHIIINPVRVQGEGAAEEIAQAIKDFNLFNAELLSPERIEVMIVGRGGGSIEDLWAFNEEIVAKAIYNSKIPVISAVGHERDVTIADLVADLRAPTPSAAAELVMPRKEDLRQNLGNLTAGLNLSIDHILEWYLNQLKDTIKNLTLLNPVNRIQQYQVKALDLARQIFVRMEHYFKLKQSQFSGMAQKLSSLSPLNILSRGYSITFKMPEGIIIKDTQSLKKGDTLKTRLHKGEIVSEVKGVE